MANAKTETTTEAKEVFLTPVQLAERWSLSEASLRMHRYRRTGPAYTKIGSRVRYRLSDIESYERAGAK